MCRFLNVVSPEEHIAIVTSPKLRSLPCTYLAVFFNLTKSLTQYVAMSQDGTESASGLANPYLPMCWASHQHFLASFLVTGDLVSSGI